MADRRAERAAARRAKDRRGFAIAAGSTVVVIGGLALLILTSSGWPEVRDTFFNPEVFADSFPDILKAFWLDVRVFCIVEVVVPDPRPGRWRCSGPRTPRRCSRCG